MAVIFILVIPLLLGVVAQYLCCRIPRRRIWRALPPVVVVAVAAVICVGRMNIWTSKTVSPLTQLFIFPGVPGVLLLLGCYLGWRLWRYRWRPRIIDDG